MQKVFIDDTVNIHIIFQILYNSICHPQKRFFGNNMVDKNTV